jgi:putative hydrolase
MKIIADMHVHSTASFHAYSTILENISYAAKMGLKAMATTDHGPLLPDAPHEWFFHNIRALPREIDGVKLVRGIEGNIVDLEGNLDLPNWALERLDWVIASFHGDVIQPSNIENHTKAYINIAKNPDVDAIGHSGQEAYKYEYEKAIKVFKEYGKIVELNELSFIGRPGSTVNCVEIAKLCKKYEVTVVVNSDSHFATHIGKFPKVLKMLDEIDFPEKLVLNANEENFFDYFKKKGIEFNE